MLKRSKWTTTLVMTAALLPACSWFKEKPPEYLGSEEVPFLEVPEGLDKPLFYSPLVIRAEDLRMPSGDELNPGPPRVASTGGGGDANAYMAWSAKGVYLFVHDTPESVARRLKFVIDRAGMEMLEGRDDGSHRFEYYHLRYDDRGFFQKMMFWRNYGGPNYSGIYQTRVEADGVEARVYLDFATGGPATTDSAEHILGIFMERLG